MKSLIVLLLAAVGASAAEPSIFTLRSVQQQADPVQAARSAGEDLRAQAQARGWQLRVVLFQETWPSVVPADGARIGDALKTAVGVPTWGTGGSQPGYITNAEPAPAAGASLVAIGIGGDGLAVEVLVDAGEVAHDYDKDAAKAPAIIALREAAYARGLALARRLRAPPAGQGACAILMGALHNDWHVPYGSGVSAGLPPGLPQAYGVGQMRDYLYADGAALFDPAGVATPTGRVLLLISGRIAVAQATRRLEDSALPQARALMAGAAVAVCRRLPAPPALIFLFGSVGFIRGSGVVTTVPYREVLDEALGPVPVHGGFLGGEGGLDDAGHLHIGGGRLSLLALAPLP